MVTDRMTMVTFNYWLELSALWVLRTAFALCVLGLLYYPKFDGVEVQAEKIHMTKEEFMTLPQDERDEMVYAAADAIAAKVNNSGPETQWGYLEELDKADPVE